MRLSPKKKRLDQSQFKIKCKKLETLLQKTTIAKQFNLKQESTVQCYLQYIQKLQIANQKFDQYTGYRQAVPQKYKELRKSAVNIIRGKIDEGVRYLQNLNPQNIEMGTIFIDFVLENFKYKTAYNQICNILSTLSIASDSMKADITKIHGYLKTPHPSQKPKLESKQAGLELQNIVMQIEQQREKYNKAKAQLNLRQMDGFCFKFFNTNLNINIGEKLQQEVKNVNLKLQISCQSYYKNKFKLVENKLKKLQEQVSQYAKFRHITGQQILKMRQFMKEKIQELTNMASEKQREQQILLNFIRNQKSQYDKIYQQLLGGSKKRMMETEVTCIKDNSLGS